jgi:hypothetical protein
MSIATGWETLSDHLSVLRMCKALRATSKFALLAASRFQRAQHVNAHAEDCFDCTLFLGGPRRILPEKMSPVIEILSPQQQIDACCLSN